MFYKDEVKDLHSFSYCSSKCFSLSSFNALDNCLDISLKMTSFFQSKQFWNHSCHFINIFLCISIFLKFTVNAYFIIDYSTEYSVSLFPSLLIHQHEVANHINFMDVVIFRNIHFCTLAFKIDYVLFSFIQHNFRTILFIFERFYSSFSL